jgi:hypothetical protein
VLADEFRARTSSDRDSQRNFRICLHEIDICFDLRRAVMSAPERGWRGVEKLNVLVALARAGGTQRVIAPSKERRGPACCRCWGMKPAVRRAQ